MTGPMLFSLGMGCKDEKHAAVTGSISPRDSPSNYLSWLHGPFLHAEAAQRSAEDLA